MNRTVCVALLSLLLGGAILSQDKPEKPKLPEYKVPGDARFVLSNFAVPRAVEHDDGTIAEFKIGASIRFPKRESFGREADYKWPGVLFISGSGSQTRHGFQGKLDIGTWELLDAIANEGFVVMAADDRGIGETPVGEEGFDTSTLGYDELVGDARACLKFLRGYEGDDDGGVSVDPERIFVIGHSEGGLTAPILAGEGGVAGVVFMAGMGRNLYDVTIDQTSDAMARLPQAMRDNNMKVQREFQDAVKEGREPDFTIVGEDEATVNAIKSVWEQKVVPLKAWWHDHFNKDVPAIHAAVDCPCLITNGKSDFQVSAEKDAKQIVRDLMASACGDVTLKLYEDLDHLLKPCNGRKSEIKMYFEDRRVDATFIKDVVNWLKQHSSAS